MSVKLLRRGAFVGVIVASALAFSTQTAFAANLEEPQAATSTPPATESPTTEAPATEAPATGAPATGAPATGATGKNAPAESPAPESSEAAEPVSEITVTISEISLDGPAIAAVEVTVQNDSDAAMRSVVVAFSGPVGWQVVPGEDDLGSIKSGEDETATFQVRIPEERSAFALRVFTANATYKGGDSAGSVTAIRAIPTAAPLAELALAFNNVGITSESDPAVGDLDGYGNTFSAEKLAAAGAGKDAELQVLGATLRMPSVEAGTADNVATAGQAIGVTGQGERLVFLGTGSTYGAGGTATVYYTDGTTSVGSIGFPNWSFQEEDAHGAQLVVSTDGRNRPNGYGDAEYQYRLFAHSVPLTAGKTVDFVILPSNPALHVFAMGIAP